MDLPKASELGVLAVSAAVIILTTCCWLVSRKPSKASRKSSEDSRTFRVRNVPLHWKATDLQTFLAEHSSPTVKSIATEIHSGSNTGTVTFKDVPLPLQASHPWDIPLSLPSEDQPFRDQYLTLDDGFLGITTLYNPLPEDHKVDVIAVSGLGSHAFGSFKERGTDFMWLRDALPYDVTSKDTGRPMARMIVYGHESTVEQSKNMQNLEDMSTSFHDSLLALARAPTVRPIILVAHSLGGLIVKQALISLSKSKNEDDLTLFRAMYGIVFFGVPHDGMQIKSLIPMVGDGPNRFLVESISSINSQILSIQQREFSKALGGQGDSEIICFYETLMSPTARKDEFGEWKMIGPSELLVTKFSATHCRSWEVGPEHICAVARTHSDMVRFRRNDHEYDNVRERLKGLAQRARVRISVSNQTYVSRDPQAKDCWRDLFLTDPLEDKNNLKRKKGSRAPNTCEWILETEDLIAWQKSGPILWLFGNPGTGKSIMSIFLAENLSEFSTTERKTIMYFFCDSSFEKRKTATGVIRGLLYQLVKQYPALLKYVLPQYHERGADLFTSFDALWTIFMNAVADTATGQKYCIIDALDECDQESQNTLLRQFQESFDPKSSSGHTLSIRMLITSRPYPEIREYLGGFAKKDLASFPEAVLDIRKFIESKMADLQQRKSYTDKVKEKAAQLLETKAEGTFLWVGMACKELDPVASKDAVKILEDLPRGLLQLYGDLLNKAFKLEGKRQTIERILNVVAVSLRPLTILELAEACQLHQGQEEKERVQFTIEEVESCRMLVVVQDTTVVLLHQSVKDFLFEYDIKQLEAHANLAYRCIEYLSTQFHLEEDDLASDRFLSYSTDFWPEHAKRADYVFHVKDAQAEFFSLDSKYLEAWRTRYTNRGFMDRRLPKDFSILHIAAMWGIRSIVDYVLKKGLGYEHTSGAGMRQKMTGFDDKNHADNERVTPLEVAAYSGNSTVINCFLKYAVETMEIREAVLNAAARNEGQGKKVLRLLLDRKGDQITITDGVVKAAARNEYQGEEVLRLLLDRKGDQITITDGLVEAAAENEDQGEEVMRLLLDRMGDQITITDGVVEAAAGNKYQGKEVLRLLLDRKGDQITITEEVVYTITESFGQQIVRLLLDRKGDQITITDGVVEAAVR